MVTLSPLWIDNHKLLKKLHVLKLCEYVLLQKAHPIFASRGKEFQVGVLVSVGVLEGSQYHFKGWVACCLTL